MSTDRDTVRRDAREALDAGKAQDAFRLLRTLIGFPGPAAAHFVEEFALFARITEALGAPELAARIDGVVARPEDGEALHELGYDLIEAGIPQVAATALARANELAPGQESVVCELVSALERAMRPAEACRVLEAVPDLVDESFICRYLLAFNTLMTGDRATPERLLENLDPEGDGERAHLRENIEGMLERARALEGTASLDLDDLRGWHLVLNGGVLLHLSPHGFESMRGRYAFVQDDYPVCREGIQRLSFVLETWNFEPVRIFAPENRGSQALAHAVARARGGAVELWPAAGRSEPGLIVVYVLGDVPPDCLTSLSEHRPGQLLWSHAACWAAESSFAPDVVTYLYQVNIAPWGEELSFGEGVTNCKPAD